MSIVKKVKINQIAVFLLPIIGIFFQGLYSGFMSAIFVLLSVFLLTMKADNISIITLAVIVLGFTLSVFFSNDIRGISETCKIMILFTTMFTANEKDKHNLLKGLYFGCFFASFIGVIAYFFNISSYGLIRSVNGIKIIQSVLGYANTMAVFSGTGSILSAYYIRKNNNCAFAHEIICGINILCLILTGSRLGIASFIFVTVAAFCIKHPRAIKWIINVLLLGILSIILLFISGKEDIIIGSTLAWRLIYWNDALKVIISNPFGTGINNWQNIQYGVQSAAYSVKYVHNGYLQTALEGGLLVFFGVMFLMFKGFCNIILKYKNTKDVFYIYLLAIFLLVIVHGFADIDFAYGSIWLVIGIVLCFVNDGKIKINKLVAVVFPVCMLITILFVPAQCENPAEKYSSQYSIALKNNNYNDMYDISKQWLSFAPRQQAAYDAHYLSLVRLNRSEELAILREKVNKTNETMNYMCKYLSEHKEIILPKGEQTNENN